MSTVPFFEQMLKDHGFNFVFATTTDRHYVNGEVEIIAEGSLLFCVNSVCMDYVQLAAWIERFKKQSDVI